MEFHCSNCRERIDREELIRLLCLLCGWRHEEIAWQTQAIVATFLQQSCQLVENVADAFKHSAPCSDAACSFDHACEMVK